MLLVGVAVAALPASAVAQAAAQYRARLSPVPIDLAMQGTVAGSGSATATLTGRTLTITGTFAGLKTPATVARLHSGVKGMRGAAVSDLTVSTGTSGTLSGTVELTAAQVDDLKSSRLYIQLHSQKAPDGNLWGWLLPQETRR